MGVCGLVAADKEKIWQRGSFQDLVSPKRSYRRAQKMRWKLLER